MAFQVDLKFKLRPENGNGSVSQANEAVREKYSRRREKHMQRPRGRRGNMTYCGECKQYTMLEHRIGSGNGDSTLPENCQNYRCQPFLCPTRLLSFFSVLLLL